MADNAIDIVKIVMFKQREWFVYRFNQGSLEGWRSFGISHERITDNRDVTVLTRALAILDKAYPDEPWFDDFHEYWVSALPATLPLVCVRPRMNPFEGGWVISPIPLAHLCR
jgi:hypothetical protein